MYSAGRPSLRLALTGAVLVVAAAGLGAFVSARHDERRARQSVVAAKASAIGGDNVDVAGFYAAVKVSMVPLVRHVKTMDSFLQQLNANPDPSPAVAALAGTWAEDMATARDLVSRLVPYAGSDAKLAQSLFEDGAALYRESALALTRLSGAADVSARLGLVRSAARLRLLGDRTFDLGRQVVRQRIGSDSDDSPSLDIVPEPVPIFSGTDDPCTAGVPVQTDPDSNSGSPAIEWKPWIAQHRANLAEAVTIVDRAEAARLSSSSTRARNLRAASDRLSGPVPAPASSGQGTIAIRLALLVNAEAACVVPSSGSPENQALAQQRTLRMTGEDLWSVGVRLVSNGVHPWPRGLSPRPTGLDPTALRTGGLFGGHPAPLRPGDPPDLGVPGGLQLPDPLQVLGVGGS